MFLTDNLSAITINQQFKIYEEVQQKLYIDSIAKPVSNKFSVKFHFLIDNSI